MAQIEKIFLGDTSYSLGAASIPFAKVDSTSTSTVFTATVPEITELKDGVCVYLMNGVVTSATNCTLNINNLGAKPIYQSLAAASRSTTIFNIGYTMLFIYNSLRVTGGCWDVFYGYNSNDNTIGYNIRDNQADKEAALAIYRYMYCFTKRDGTIFPSTSTSNKTTTNKTLNTDIAFDPTLPIYYYGYTTTINAGSSPSASYLWLKNTACSLQYGFNVATDSLNLKEPVYLQCSPQSNGTLKLANNNCVTQTLPTSADGYVYLYLGQTYSGHQIEFAPMHPCFIYDSRVSDIVVWQGAEYARKSELANYAPLSSPAFTGTPTIGGYNVLTTQDLTKVMHFRGVSSTSITDGGTETATIGGNSLTAEEGDIVIYNNVEFIWNGSTWEEIGEETKLADLDERAPVIIELDEDDTIGTQYGIQLFTNSIGYTKSQFKTLFDSKTPIIIHYTNTDNEVKKVLLSKYQSVSFAGTIADCYYTNVYLDNFNPSSPNHLIYIDIFIFNSDSSIGFYHTSSISADYAGSADWATNATNASNATSADITTTQNAVAKYSDTSGTFANTGVIIDSNNNITTTGNLTATELKGYVTVGQLNGSTLGQKATAEGCDTIASGYASHAEGCDTTASGGNSHAEGNNTIASGSLSHAEGEGTMASGSLSHAEGEGTMASGQTSHAEGIWTTASGEASHAEGGHTEAWDDGTADFIYLTGNGTTYTYNTEYESMAIYNQIYCEDTNKGTVITNISGNTIIVASTLGELNNTQCAIINPETEGATILGPMALGDYSHAEGNGTVSLDVSSHAEGCSTVASGSSSHAEGGHTIASKWATHAEGDRTTASGWASHAEGIWTVASGEASHAEGHNTTASGRSSHAEGYYTIAQRVKQHVFGQYNILDTSKGTLSGTTWSFTNSIGTTSDYGKYIEIVGNGSGSSARSNARTLDWNGNETLSGKLTVGIAPTENMDVATKQYVDNSVSTFANLPTMYWANSSVTSAASYNAAPEMATLKLNGNTSASAASSKNVTFEYNSTTETLNFVFT